MRAPQNLSGHRLPATRQLRRALGKQDGSSRRGSDEPLGGQETRRRAPKSSSGRRLRASRLKENPLARRGRAFRLRRAREIVLGPLGGPKNPRPAIRETWGLTRNPVLTVIAAWTPKSPRPPPRRSLRSRRTFRDAVKPESSRTRLHASNGPWRSEDRLGLSPVVKRRPVEIRRPPRAATRLRQGSLGPVSSRPAPPQPPKKLVLRRGQRPRPSKPVSAQSARLQAPKSLSASRQIASGPTRACRDILSAPCARQGPVRALPSSNEPLGAFDFLRSAEELAHSAPKSPVAGYRR